ncbi:hypothetical protein BN1708_017890, partial [Verticillium longisporum]
GGPGPSGFPPSFGGFQAPGSALPNTAVSPIPFIRRLVATGFDYPAILHGFFGDDWVAGVGRLHEAERRNYLFAAKSRPWLSTIEEVHQEGGKILSFLSYCGGLPAPEASDNPLGYKFSWSSRGVLLALRNAAKYYQGGSVVDVQSKDLMGTAKPYFIYPGYAFVAYPNRDS